MTLDLVARRVKDGYTMHCAAEFGGGMVWQLGWSTRVFTLMVFSTIMIAGILHPNSRVPGLELFMLKHHLKLATV